VKDILEKLQIKDVNLGSCAGPDDWYEDPEGEEIVSYNPTTGEPIAKVLQATEKTYDKVLKLAVESFKKWRMMPAPKKGEIGDYVWFDGDCDGIQYETEKGIKGVTVTLYDGLGTFIAQTMTDASGNYSFTDLEPGTYEVYVYVPEDYATTTSARYWVAHRDGFTLRKVNQASNTTQWVSLGTYQFRGTDGEYVSLADITYESYLSRQIAFDAVKWVSR